MKPELPTQSPASNDLAVVSILIPAFNAGPWIRQCVESALAQTYPAKEVIVVDDGSTDDTLEILKAFGNRIQLAEGTHAGGNAARNRLLEMANGEWLQYLDADDYLLPHKIEMQMQRVAQDPDLALVYSPVILRDENNGSERLLAISDVADLPLHYIRWGQLNTNGFLWRRSSVTKAGGWKVGQAACQEHELLLRMMEAGARFSLVNEPSAVYRFHRVASVSRENPLRTIELQMELLDRMQGHLTRQGQLLPVHRKALYIARMQAARTAWQSDRERAIELASKARSTGSWWVSSSNALPMSFQIMECFMGFGATERLAAMRRPML